MKAIKHYKNSLLLTFSGMLLVLASCKKDKLDITTDNRPVTETRSNSSLRIINLGGFNQVQANGDTLTNYVVRTINDPLSGKYPGTEYFPDNGRLGTIWNIPQNLLNQGRASLLIEEKSFQGFNSKTSLSVEEQVNQPTDYFITQPEESMGLENDGGPDYVQFKRDITAPANPGNFKIRIINLAAKVGHMQNQEDLLGPMSLAFADGTPVSGKTSHIAPGEASEYIEVPYGTIQFKVLSKSGTEVSGISDEVISAETSQIINQSSGTSMMPSIRLTYAPMKTYAPGGVYTIVVSPYRFTIPYPGSEIGETINTYQNGFRLLNDIAEPLNMTYAKVQAINALPGVNQVKLLLNGQAAGTEIPYGGHAEEQTLITGNYKVDAVDASGQLLATVQLKLEAHTNLSLWICRDAAGKAKISVVANDLSGIFGIGGDDDATNSGYLQKFPVSVRFLNMSDMPYLTFTTDNGQNFNANYAFDPAVVSNLVPGLFPIQNPYVSIFRDSNPYKFLAYRSMPSIVPGEWADEIPVLTGQSLIARPELYVRGQLPNHEPGIYTIALIGNTSASAPAAQKARMIVLKHNK